MYIVQGEGRSLVFMYLVYSKTKTVLLLQMTCVCREKGVSLSQLGRQGSWCNMLSGQSDGIFEEGHFSALWCDHITKGKGGARGCKNCRE